MNDLQRQIALKILQAYYKHEKKFNLPKGFNVIDLIALAGIETSLGADTVSYPLGIFQFLEATWKDIEDRILKGAPCKKAILQMERAPLSNIDCQVYYALAYISSMHPSWGIPDSGLDSGAQIALWWQSGGCASKSYYEALRSGSENFCKAWQIQQDKCLRVKAVPPCERIERYNFWKKRVIDFFGKVILNGLEP